MKEIKVLGTGCAKCKSTVALIEQVAQAKGIEVTLQKVEEPRDIMSYNVMSTPGSSSMARSSMPAGCRAATRSNNG